jgi:hypothetical protein
MQLQMIERSQTQPKHIQQRGRNFRELMLCNLADGK